MKWPSKISWPNNYQTLDWNLCLEPKLKLFPLYSGASFPEKGVEQPLEKRREEYLEAVSWVSGKGLS